MATQSISNRPMVVEAKDASGRPVPNVAITWAIIDGSGTITSASSTTDATGQASANFVSTSLQPGASFLSATVTASSIYGTVRFVITTVVASSLQPEVSIQVISPTLDNPTLTAASGSTIPAGIVVQVVAAGGGFTGAPIPNVGVQIVDGVDLSSAGAASCAGPTGIVLTDYRGMATCDLVVSGASGTVEQLRAYVGSFQYTRALSLTITPGQNCNYSLSATSQSVGSAGGTGSVNIATSSGCGWSASSNSGFINITSATSGTGNGSVSYAVEANSGPARSGTLIIAGRTYTVNESAAGGGPSALTISPPTLPDGKVGSSYQIMLTATGGIAPYTWSPAGSISTSGLSFQSNGNITGTPATAGTYPFTATVTDITGATKTQTYSITVNGTGTPPSGLTITNTSFPNGAVGQSYPSQLLIALGGCVTPFSPQPSFTVNSGTLPLGLSIQRNSDGTHSIAGTPSTGGSSTFTLLATDPCGKTATASFTITIAGTPTSVQVLVSPASLSFTVQAGAASAPANQTLTISSNSSAVSYTAAVSTTSGANWLIANGATSGTTPGTVSVGAANFTSLASGAYNGSITITSSASNSPVVVPVTLTVLAATSLTVSPTSITVNETVSSASPVSQQPITLASGTTPIQFTASATTNSAGAWLFLSPTQGNTPATLTAVINAQGLAVGQYTGTITIMPASGAAQTVTITLNVTAPATLSATPAPVTFTYQQAGSLPGSQSVAVNSSGTPLSVSISAATQNGGTWLMVSPPNGTTTVNLSVSVSPIGLLPGSYSGAITITPSDSTVAPLTIPVSLTVTQSAPSVAGATNAASYAPGPVAPGEIVTIFGTGLGPSTLTTLQITDSGTVATNLGGTQVFFDGYPAPLIYSSATQVSVIVPYEVAGTGTTSMMIQYQGTRSNSMTVPVLDALPGIFTASALGYGQGAIVNQDGSINSTQNGADPGSIVSIYATGAGQTNPFSVDGSITSNVLATPQLPVTVQIAGEDAQVLYAGAAPGEPAGVLQVNAQIPADVLPGTSVSVVITVGSVSSQAGVTVAIKP
jgi:uncharacterized protein (TIGR03437 family)